MSEFYTVKQHRSTIGNYANVDEAEIVKALTPKSVLITQQLNVEFRQGYLACYEDNGEFYIQNESSEKVCTLQVSIEAHDCSGWHDSTSSIEADLSEEYYHAYINNVEVNDINLTDVLKRDIQNTIESFIARVNEQNN